MNRRIADWLPCTALAVIALNVIALAMAAPPTFAQKIGDSAAARRVFVDPPREYATAPLWVWNDLLTDDQIRGTLRDLAAQRVRQAFVHPRPGLMTPYLSDEWFRLWRVALDEAERLDMHVWIYDENSYPSGFAGGHVPQQMPESRGRGLVLRSQPQPPSLDSETLGAYRVEGDSIVDVTADIRQGRSPGQGPFWMATVARAANSPWYGDRSYVDLMYPGVTEKFLEVTQQAYKKHLGDQFGRRILGSFTDEPNVRPAGGLPWTDRLPAEFHKRWGYDLLPHLPSLAAAVGNWKQVRHDYFQVVLDQFVEHWAKPYARWCEQNGIAFTGHYWDHEWPNCVGVPDNMAMNAWQHIPGIDCLMNQYQEHTHAQFGNLRFVRETQSVCNQLGRERFLCEVYGAGGWDLRFEDMKRIADWLGVLGVNLFDQHLSYVTLRGARKADHPQSFSYHEPWWDAYHVLADYTTRLSAAMSSGQQRNEILVLEPTTTAWMYQADPTHRGRLNELGATFFDFLKALEAAQVEYDIGCEDVIARHGSVAGGASGGQGIGAGQTASGSARLVVGQREYATVVLPPLTETLRAETVALLEQAASGGLRILCCGPPPSLVDARPSPRLAKLADSPTWQRLEPAATVEALIPRGPEQCVIRRAADDPGILFHQRRQLADGDLLFLVNTSSEHASRGTVTTPARAIQQWDLFTGAARDWPCTTDAAGVSIEFELPPCGSLLLWLARDAAPPADSHGQAASQTPPCAISGALVGAVGQPPAATPVAPRGPLEARRIEPNVLTLDYVDVSAGGESRRDLYYYPANQFVWRAHGMARNPWDSAVQYNDELISKTFPPDSGFEVSYRFTIDGAVPRPLWLVIERPDLYTIQCNGAAVQVQAGQWWLDKAFGKLDITASARAGETVVTLKAQPFTMFHELAAAYVLGDFSLRPEQSGGFTIVSPRPPGLVRGLAHSTDLEGVSWLSSGIGFQRDPRSNKGNDPAPSVVFDLGRQVDLAAIDIWNYNEATLPSRGVKSLEILAAATPDFAAGAKSLGEFELAAAPGGPRGAHTALAQRLAVVAPGVRYVKFAILANYNGVRFPAADGGKDHAFVGLSEVRFLAPAADGRPQRIQGVKIHSASSELAASGSFDRRAVHLVDDSGLGEAAVGWDQQGMPFYAAGVAYRQTFDVAHATGRYRVRVPRWYGSVAKVVANGQVRGILVSQPWEVDVTGAIREGENAVEVVVIGTLKNTLGPHHAGSATGSAWPGMFQRGPEHGPPPGDAYHTLGYGLFEPFTLLHDGDASPDANQPAS